VKPSSGYQLVATMTRKGDGSTVTEDLGTIEAVGTSHAIRKAKIRFAGRFGWQRTRTGGWSMHGWKVSAFGITVGNCVK
jgi:hypothetical protein